MECQPIESDQKIRFKIHGKDQSGKSYCRSVTFKNKRTRENTKPSVWKTFVKKISNKKVKVDVVTKPSYWYVTLLYLDPKTNQEYGQQTITVYNMTIDEVKAECKKVFEQMEAHRERAWKSRKKNYEKHKK